MAYTTAQVVALLSSYWGKASAPDTSGGPNHHTVLGHSLDVAACAVVMIERNPVLRRQLAASVGLDVESVAPTFAGIIALHDIGKFDTRFQRKAPHIADRLRPHTASIALDKYDHGTEGFRQVEDDEETAGFLTERLGSNALILLRAVCSHHGAFVSRDDPDPSRSGLPLRIRAEDAEARRAFVACVLDFFTAHGASLPWPARIDGAIVQRLAGLCALADWLGSDTSHFPYTAGPVSDLADYWTRACGRAEAACAGAGLIRVAAAHVGFGDLFPAYSPRGVQVLAEQLPVEGPALVIIEAEMGAGKTEAALTLAAKFLRQGVSDGVTVALPTMATANAMFARVEDVAGRFFPGETVQLSLAHGRARRQQGFQHLIERALRAHDPEAPEASVVCARWLLNRKRILLAQLGVGTVDQALQAALVIRHQFVRLFGLSRNVVIIDEIHAYDAYMEVLVEHLLSWLGALGVPVILLSATLPSHRRLALSQAWRGTIGPDDARQEEVVDSLEAARARDYPLVSVTTRERSWSSPVAHPSVAKTLQVEYRNDGAADDAAVVARLISAARDGARVVWVRNTVREAQQAFSALAAGDPDGEHTLFHSRFRGCDRGRIEQVVLYRFGKNAPSGGRVLIATQVVEQSLDLDFDEMHTDLAPIDLVFQRAGRLHRHQRHRPAAYQQPRLVVHGPSAEDAATLRLGPSQYVYDVGTLWIAARTLRERRTLVLPDDIRPLIEETYHPTSRSSLLSSGGAGLVAAEDQRADELQARRTKARRCCIPPTTADPIGASDLPDDDEAISAFTRDGISKTVLPFVWTGHGGRSLDSADGDPTWSLDAARPDAWQLATELLDQMLAVPERSQLEGDVPDDERARWNAWRKQFRRFAEDAGFGSRVTPLPLRYVGNRFRGNVIVAGRRRTVEYSPALGLSMRRDEDEEHGQ